MKTQSSSQCRTTVRTDPICCLGAPSQSYLLSRLWLRGSPSASTISSNRAAGSTLRPRIACQRPPKSHRRPSQSSQRTTSRKTSSSNLYPSSNSRKTRPRSTKTMARCLNTSRSSTDRRKKSRNASDSKRKNQRFRQELDSCQSQSDSGPLKNSATRARK